MIYFVVAVLLALCAVSTIAPLRANAVCTPATHRFRLLLGVVCALACVHAVALFVWYVGVQGHPITANVVVGRVVNVLLGVQAWLLLRSIFLRARYAIPIAASCAVFAIVAVVHALA